MKAPGKSIEHNNRLAQQTMHTHNENEKREKNNKDITFTFSLYVYFTIYHAKINSTFAP